jgi:S1-C subfamily serine protease
MTRTTRLGLLALACVVVAIMAFDVRARSQTGQPSAAEERASAPAEPAVPEVQRGLDKTPLVYPAKFVDHLVQGRRAAFVLARPEGGGDPVAGVLVGARDVLLADAGPSATWNVARAGVSPAKATRRAVDPVHGLSLLTLDADAADVLPFGAAAQTSGSPVVAVRPTPAALVTQLIPAPGTEASLAARLAASALPPGTAVVDLDGRLVAFFGVGVSGGVPVLAGELDDKLLPALRQGRAPALPWLGADLQALDPRLRRTFGDGIGVVTYVEADSPASLAGLRPRDVLSSARVGGRLASDLGSLQDALRPDTRLDLEVRRDGATRRIAVDVGRRRFPGGVSASSGVAVRSGSHPVLRVAPASALAAAGLRTGDVVERVDGRVVPVDLIERTLVRSHGAVVTVQRDGERRFVVLPDAGPPERRAP